MNDRDANVDIIIHNSIGPNGKGNVPIIMNGMEYPNMQAAFDAARPGKPTVIRLNGSHKEDS